jgi:cellulose synthase/poly-beta-1,6-N-acetylglucosamine synthase-like glycosyltransferase/predicted Zn-dependent protease
MTLQEAGGGLFNSRGNPMINNAGDPKIAVAEHSFKEVNSNSVSAMFEVRSFMERVDSRLRAQTRRGSLAFIEIQDPYDAENVVQGIASLPADAFNPELFHLINEAIGQDDIFSWQDGRFILLFSQAETTHRTLRKLARQIAKYAHNVHGAPAHLTPAIGYVDLRLAKTAEELWQKAETALDCAKSSLEIEPFRYVRKLSAHSRGGLLSRSLTLWNTVPQCFGLSVQLILTLLLGLGAPFIFYAICDALGANISGPVYIGVVVVLVITATTIWIEGFLALKSTTPPQEPGSPFPPATVIIPAYLPNEADTIIETVNAFLRLDYPNTVQIIIAYNSPTHLPVERELEAMAASKEHAGRFIIEPVRVAGSTSKAQNVNAVIGRVRGRFVGIFDADHHPRPDSLQRAWRWLSNGWDVVQGRCSIRNGADSWVSRMVAIEFEQIYAVSHPGRGRLHGFGIFGGSNGFWRTAVLHQTRMRHAMLTEDIDSSIRAVEAGYKIASDRNLVSEELAPTSLSQLLNQRLRWAQGWFQVSLRRIIPALLSPEVSLRQKLGLIHLLVWRELFPWYSIQVVPIMTYWVWAYGWHYIHWAVPIFVITTIYTFSTGPGQILFAYLLAEKAMRRRPGWFIEYLIVSTLFFSPFKDTLSRIAHLKEAMRERAWRVTPRTAPAKVRNRQLAQAALILFFVILVSTGKSAAETTDNSAAFSREYFAALLGGEVSTINAARDAAKNGHNEEAARLFAKAIDAVPNRRPELLREYADALSYANRSSEAVPLYRELLSSPNLHIDEKFDIEKHLGLALTWSNQYPAALTVYNDLMEQTSGDADVAVHRARVLTWLGRPDAAVAALDRVAPAKWTTGSLGMLGDEILTDAARKAAQTNQNEAATHFFERVIRHNASLRSPLLREYADQLAFSDRVPESIPLYHEAIDNPLTSDADRTEAQLGLAQALLQSRQPVEAYKLYAVVVSQEPIGTERYRRAQRGLSLALTWSDSPAKALSAWAAYLKTSPADVDAILHKAQVHSTLHQNAEALQAYKAAYAMDRNNETAKRGIVDETVNLARAAARNDRNSEAAALFLAAINLDSRKRKDLLREYADQLSFGGRPADAIPIYREVLSFDALSPLDRKRAMKGLTDAYAWAADPDKALAAYTELVNTFPGDDSYQWEKLVFAARQDAQINKNKESADLFAQAIAIRSVSSTSILREYADQLSFTGQASSAIPIYREVLDQQTLAEPDRLSAQKALAQAYDWSGRLDEAKSAYNELIADHPNDVAVQWGLLVVSAHEAAKVDRNKEAATLLAEAIRLVPAQRLSILKEYADKLSFTDQSSSAIALYREVIDQPTLSDLDRLSAQKALAQAYDWSGRYVEANSLYNVLIKNNPNDLNLKWGLLVVSAHQAAKVDRNKEAASYFAEAIRLVPERRRFILKEYADKLTYSGDSKAAIPLYRELIAQGGTPASIRSDELALALALAWDNELTAALSEYQILTKADPNDIDARNGMARILSWTGDQSAAEGVFQETLTRSPNNPEALRGLAQVEDWLGHHRMAQTLLDQRLKDDPKDLEARRLLAQSLVWMGRPDRAMEELAIALGPLAGSANIQPNTGGPDRKKEIGIPRPAPTTNHSASEQLSELQSGLQPANLASNSQQ